VLYAIQQYRIVSFAGIDELVLSNQTSSNTSYDVVILIPRTPSDGSPYLYRKIAKLKPDGSGTIYVPLAYPTHWEEEDNKTWVDTAKLDKYFGKMLYLEPPYNSYQIYAHGMRNSVGLDWDPVNGELWFTDNGHNGLGYDVPGEELNRISAAGSHFGYPYCHGCCINEPTLAADWICPNYTIPPVISMDAHTAPLNMIFYRGTMFPTKYQNGIFLTLHGPGSLAIPQGRSTKGVNIMFVSFDNNYREPIGIEVFASGWVNKTSYDSRWGRPAGLLELPDGSLLVSDDYYGAIYRITYSED